MRVDQYLKDNTKLRISDGQRSMDSQNYPLIGKTFGSADHIDHVD